MIKNKYKILYLPIENNSRELDAKILIAIEAIKNDYIVIIGSKLMLKLMKLLPQGCFFYKDASAPMGSYFEILKNKGHKVVVHDEEGLVQHSWSEYIQKRIRKETLLNVDIFFCWGNEQYKAVKNYIDKNNLKTKLYKVGHPRIDLLCDPIIKYNDNIDINIKSKYILINTKFGEINHRKGKHAWLDILKEHDMIKNHSDYERSINQMKYKKDLMTEYIDMIYFISQKYPEKIIVIRPHPIENIKTWKNEFINQKNVVVTNSLTISNWIYNAEIVIHTGCTTGIEAFIMGKHVISFKPIKDIRYEVKLPDLLSTEVYNKTECYNTINDIFNSELKIDNTYTYKYNIIKQHIENIKEDTSKYILYRINKLSTKEYGMYIVKYIKIVYIKYRILYLIKRNKYKVDNNEIIRKIKEYSKLKSYNTIINTDIIASNTIVVYKND